MGWTIAGFVFLALQIMSWIGNKGIALGGGSAAGIGYTIGANIGLILAIIFFILGARHKAKKAEKAAQEDKPENKQ